MPPGPPVERNRRDSIPDSVSISSSGGGQRLRHAGTCQWRKKRPKRRRGKRVSPRVTSRPRLGNPGCGLFFEADVHCACSTARSAMRPVNTCCMLAVMKILDPTNGDGRRERPSYALSLIGEQTLCAFGSRLFLGCVCLPVRQGHTLKRNTHPTSRAFTLTDVHPNIVAIYLLSYALISTA